MKFNYKSMQSRATALLNRFNESDIQIIRTTGTTMVDGEAVKGVESIDYVVGVVAPISSFLVNNTTIKAGDMLATITHIIEPKMTDKFVIGGDRYEVIAINTYRPSDTVLAYKVQLRA